MSKDLKACADDALQAGTITTAQHQQLMDGVAKLQAFDWTSILGIITQILPILASVIPGLAPFMAIFNSFPQLIALIQQIFTKLPVPIPTPTPIPLPGPGPGPVPTPSA